MTVLRELPKLAAAVTAALLLVACSSTATDAPAAVGAGFGQPPVPVIAAAPVMNLPVTVTDTTGQQVTVTDASRIVALSGGIAETLVAMGLGSTIIGRDASAEFPEIAEVPLVTNGHEVSAEGLLALAPTLVLGDSRTGPAQALDAVRKAGVPVVLVPEVWSMSEAAARTTAVAAAVGAPAAGSAVNDRIAADIAAVRSEFTEGKQGGPVVAFLYVRGAAAVYLLGGDGSGADDLVEALGGVDAGTRAGLTAFTPLTPESLAAAQPDVLLVMDKGLESVGGIDGLVALPGVAQTTAGRDRRVVSVADGQLLSFGPRTPQTLRTLAAGLAGSSQ